MDVLKTPELAPPALGASRGQHVPERIFAGGNEVQAEVGRAVKEAKRNAYLASAIVLFLAICVLKPVIPSVYHLSGKKFGRVVTFSANGSWIIITGGSFIAASAMFAATSFQPQIGTRVTRITRQLIMPSHILFMLGMTLAGMIQRPFVVAVILGKIGLSIDLLLLEIFLGMLTGIVYSVFVLVNDLNIVRFSLLMIPPSLRLRSVLSSALKESRRLTVYLMLPSLFLSFFFAKEQPRLLLILTVSFALILTWSIMRHVHQCFLTRWKMKGNLEDALHAASSLSVYHLRAICLLVVRDYALRSSQTRKAFYQGQDASKLDGVIKLAMEPADTLCSTLQSIAQQEYNNSVKIQPVYWNSVCIRWGLETVAAIFSHAEEDDTYGMVLPYYPVVLANLLALYEALVHRARSAMIYDDTLREKHEETGLLDSVVSCVYRIISAHQAYFESYLTGAEPRWNSDMSPVLKKFLNLQET